MKLVDLPLDRLTEARWNANRMDSITLSHLAESIRRFGLVQNLVVRPLADGNYEVLSGNQRLQVLRVRGQDAARCAVVELDDAQARLLAQALNRVHGEDDLGLRAELVREVLEKLPKEEILSLLPETAESLASLASLGQGDMADHLRSWQQAQDARLKHLQFQLTSTQLEAVEEVMARLLPRARKTLIDSPNARGTALYLLCVWYLESERKSE